MRNAGILGKYNEPGIPDLTGNTDVGGFSNRIAQPSGVFQTTVLAEKTYFTIQPSETFNLEVENFLASRSSSVFGASDTVMPASGDILFGLYLGCPAEV